MDLTDAQVSDYAKQLAVKGASDSEIEDFVKSARPQAVAKSALAAVDTTPAPDATEKPQPAPNSAADFFSSIIPGSKIDHSNDSYHITLPSTSEGYQMLKQSLSEADPRQLAALGIRAGATAAGQTLGSRYGAPGRSIGGAIGSGIGEVVGALSEGQSPTLARTGAAIVRGAVPGRGLDGASGGRIAIEAAKYAGTEAVATGVEAAIDPNNAPTLAQAGNRLAMAAAGAPMAARFAQPSERAFEQTDAEKRSLMKLDAYKDLSGKGIVANPAALGQSGNIEGVDQIASDRNANVWQKLGRQVIGLSDEPLPIAKPDATTGKLDSSLAFNDFRKLPAQAGPYQQIEAIQKRAATELKLIKSQFSNAQDLEAALNSPNGKRLQIQAAADVEELKSVRDKAKDAYDSFKDGNPDARALWKSYQTQAEGLENTIDQAAILEGDPKLLPNLVNARRNIAQSYALENATYKITGEVDPRLLARQAKDGVMLTGDLLKMANFAGSFPKNAAVNVPPPASMVGQVAEKASRGYALGAVAKAATALPKRYLLSDFKQSSIGNPVQRQNFASAFARYLAEDSASQP